MPDSSNSKQRIDWIDHARGTAILLVMFAHSPTYPPLSTWIYTFHVPVFFFLSGRLFNNEKHTNILNLIKSRTKSLLVPYAAFSVFGLIWQLLYSVVKSNTDAFWAATPKAIVGTFLGIRGTSPWNGTLWFITCLFVVEVMYGVLSTVFQRKRTILLITSSVISYCAVIAINTKINITSIWNIDIALIMIFFFAFGNFTQRIIFTRPNRLTTLILILVLATATIWVANENGRVDAYFLILNNPLLYYFGSSIGILLTQMACSSIPKCKPLIYIGRTSIIFLAFHVYSVFAILKLLIHRTHLDISSSTQLQIITGFAFTIIGVVSILPIAVLLERRAPILLGRPV